MTIGDEQALQPDKGLVSLHLVVMGLVTSIAYLQVLGHTFVWDTLPFVLENPWLQDWSGANLVAMFTEAHRANWQPLVWLSHSIDFQIFGTNPAGHHLVNVLLHAFNGALIYFLILTMAKETLPHVVERQWFAFLVALIFLVHPQHVESVAWVVERKDVLYTLFTLACFIAYIHAARVSLLVVVFYALALMSKPMAVTVPAILVLFDVYPIRKSRLVPRDLLASIVDKWLLLTLAVLVSLVTLRTQSGAMPLAGELPDWTRVANAVDNTWFYIEHYLVPTQLSPFYPFPPVDEMRSISYWGDGAVFLVAGFTLSLICYFRGVLWPGLLFGFYLVTLLPVSGLIHVGPAKGTDHYTYLATLSLGVLTAAGCVALYRVAGKFRALVIGFITFYCLALVAITVAQVSYWANPLTLWTRVEQLHPESAFAHRNLAAVYLDLGEVDEAIRHAEKSKQYGGPVDDYLKSLREYAKQTENLRSRQAQ